MLDESASTFCLGLECKLFAPDIYDVSKIIPSDGQQIEQS